MVGFQICRKCPFGEFTPEERDEDGRLKVCPSVRCRKTEDLLLMNSEPPDICPYHLEHQMYCQDIPPEHADALSGGPRRQP
jgi:hypothetical protein